MACEAWDLRDKLLTLTEDISEYATYLRELGVGGLEASFDSDANAPFAEAATEMSRAAAPLSTALARNANSTNTPAVTAPRNANATPATRVGGATATASAPSRNFGDIPRVGRRSPSSTEETEMGKRTPLQPPSDEPPPPPQDTLFGEVTPQDKLSLPRPGETLEDIRADIGECVRCPLHETRTRIVHSEGFPQARLMFVGEAPGADEDAQGRPFVGRAGQLLNKIIDAIGLKREEIFIGNVNRCRPPQNRTPTTAEAATCKPFLLREIDVVKPEVIVVLGNVAMKNLLDTKEGITRLRGKFQDYQGIKVMPTFHPAYLLRDPSKKREAWDDMKKVRDYLNETRSKAH